MSVGLSHLVNWNNRRRLHDGTKEMQKQEKIKDMHKIHARVIEVL